MKTSICQRWESNHAVWGVSWFWEGVGRGFSGLDHIHWYRQTLSTPFISARAVDISCWYSSLVELTQNNWLLHLYKPLSVTKVVIWHDSWLGSSWWYSHFKSSFLKTLEPLMLCSSWLTVGTGCQPPRMASFARLVLTQRQMSPSAFGIITSGFTHGVGPSTSSMVS